MKCFALFFTLSVFLCASCREVVNTIYPPKVREFDRETFEAERAAWERAGIKSYRFTSVLSYNAPRPILKQNVKNEKLAYVEVLEKRAWNYGIPIFAKTITELFYIVKSEFEEFSRLIDDENSGFDLLVVKITYDTEYHYPKKIVCNRVFAGTTPPGQSLSYILKIKDFIPEEDTPEDPRTTDPFYNGIPVFCYFDENFNPDEKDGGITGFWYAENGIRFGFRSAAMENGGALRGSFYWNKDKKFPYMAVFENGNDKIDADFSEYNDTLLSYDIAFSRGNDNRVVNDVSLPKILPEWYREDAELTKDQNDRMRIIWATMYIFDSLRVCISNEFAKFGPL